MIETLHDAIEFAKRSHEYLTLPENVAKLLPYSNITHIDVVIEGVLVEIEHTGFNQYSILVLEN